MQYQIVFNDRCRYYLFFFFYNVIRIRISHWSNITSNFVNKNTKNSFMSNFVVNCCIPVKILCYVLLLLMLLTEISIFFKTLLKNWFTFSEKFFRWKRNSVIFCPWTNNEYEIVFTRILWKLVRKNGEIFNWT